MVKLSCIANSCYIQMLPYVQMGSAVAPSSIASFLPPLCPVPLLRLDICFWFAVISVSFNFGGIFCQMAYLETEVFYTSGSFHTARQFVRACVLHSQMAARLNSWRKKLFSTTTK